MKKPALYTIIIISAFWGCNKSQHTVKKLEGAWVLSSISSAGNDITYKGIGHDSLVSLDEMYTYKFLSCKVKKDSCYGEVSGFLTDTSTSVMHGITYPFKYQVDKKTINMYIDFGKGTETYELTISDIGKEQLILDFSAEGTEYEIILDNAEYKADVTK